MSSGYVGADASHYILAVVTCNQPCSAKATWKERSGLVSTAHVHAGS